MPNGDYSLVLRTAILGIVFALGACASNGTDEEANIDPWEPVNRPIHGFNHGLDTVIVKPIAKGYEFIVPSFMRRGVTNFSRNLRAPANSLNNLLQGKGGAAVNELGRFIANSTFGILGLFDVATPTGLPVSPEDFGQTFAAWGIPDGPFVIVPFLGPRTLRGAFAIPLNYLTDPLTYYDNSSVRDKLWGLRLIDVRQRLFAAEELIEDAQDRYIAVRGAYRQNRRFLIYDGNPPDEDDDLYEEFPDDE
jgi:phospholipid-binding lipoprotein MlaA